MTKTPKLTAATLVLVAGAAGAAAADVVNEVETNIALFDELLVCSTAPLFQIVGFDVASPCNQWLLDANAQIQADGDILTAGYECTADELIMGGHLLWIDDNESFNRVADKFNACRTQIASN